MIEAGNELCSASAARIGQDFVIKGSADEPFPRRANGSVEKKRPFELHQEEIERWYDSMRVDPGPS